MADRYTPITNADFLDGIDSTEFLLLTGGTLTGNLLINKNSTTALLVEQDGVKDNVLIVDTTNGWIGINRVPEDWALDITGSFRATKTGNLNYFQAVNDNGVANFGIIGTGVGDAFVQGTNGIRLYPAADTTVRARFNTDGTIQFNAYTTDGFVKFTSSTGTLGVDTSTYLTSVTAHNLLSATHGDSTVGSVVLGDLIYGTGSPVKWTQFAANSTATKKFLNMTSSIPSWDTLGSGDIPALAYLPITGGTLTGHLLFTDNTYDIGALGATRPRSLFLSANVTAAGTVQAEQLTSTDDITISNGGLVGLVGGPTDVLTFVNAVGLTSLTLKGSLNIDDETGTYVSAFSSSITGLAVVPQASAMSVSGSVTATSFDAGSGLIQTTGDVQIGDDLLIPNANSIINFGSGDITLTYTADTLTVAGMTTFDLGTSNFTTTGTVGIGTAAVTTTSLEIIKTATVTYNGIDVQLTCNPGSADLTFNALSFVALPKTSSQNIANVRGLHGGVQLAVTGAYTGTIAEALAVSATITLSQTSATTITNAYLFKGNSLTKGINAALTNAYGLYLPAITAGATLNYAIYSVSGKSYHGGNFGIGVIPTVALDVVGAGKFTTTVTASGGLITPKGAITLGVGATTIAATTGFHVITGDGGGNTIATITGGVDGQILKLLFVDTLVVITDDNTHAANSIDLSAVFTSADDTVLTLIFDGTSWYECGRSVN